MALEDLIILIPSHSLEDFPTDLPEESAAGLLNAFCITWHPKLLAAAEVIPRWHRADDPPQLVENRLVVIPKCSHDWLPHGWAEQARSGGCVVLENLYDRQEMIAAALEAIDTPVSKDESTAIEAPAAPEEAGDGADAPAHEMEPPPVIFDAELVADFLAVGFCYLQTELLARHMRHYSNLDEVHLQREAVAAAQAAVAGENAIARNHLRSCFEVLTDARERFYPVDCYLVDLCLLIPRLADRHFTDVLNTLNPVNVLVTAEDLQEIAEKDPVLVELLREAWERGTADLLGGEFREACTQLLPLESVLWQFDRGIQVFEKLFQKRPKVWGRRRFGVAPQIPQILDKHNYEAAMHVALDDGIYPDEEQSKIRWEGCDGSVIDAITRIPLAGDSSTSFLRFPERMAESMDHDHVATVVLARWPEVETPWMEDLRRMQAYAPVLGRFVTLSDYFQQTDSPGRLSAFKSNEYLTPFFVQAVARQEKNPGSRYADHLQRRQRLQAAKWFGALNQVLRGESLLRPVLADLESQVELAGPESEPDDRTATDEALAGAERAAARKLTELITQGGAEEPGYLILNPLGFSRLVKVDLPELAHPPARVGSVKRVQWDDRTRAAVVDVPGMGFAWVTAGSGGENPPPVAGNELPLAESHLLRNEFFELMLNEHSGGIQRLKGYGRKPNRLSHQITFRYANERTLPNPDPDEEAITTAYAEMRLRSTEVLSAGPSMGEVLTTGEIIDQQTGNVLASFTQTYRVWRSRPKVEIELTLDPKLRPDGNPWLNYYTLRVAWNDSSASLTRGVLYGAQDIKDERFENLYYLEIANSDERTTILNYGAPFQRTTGMRMVDYILIAAGETQRTFRFDICLDENYPMQAALDGLTPPTVLPSTRGPRGGAQTGWFFNVDAKSVQLLDILPLREPPSPDLAEWDRSEVETTPTGNGFALRLVETEGRAVRVKLRCFRDPVEARQRDFAGRTISDLTVEGDTVFVDMTGFEIADVELRF